MRTVTQLHHWKFHMGDVPEAFYKGYDDSAWKAVFVPHDWLVEYPFDKSNSSGTGYLPGGTGWYRAFFTLPKLEEGQKVNVTFLGVYNHSQVWCNSNYLGKRPNGYSSFSYDVTPFVKEGENQISVRVDHKETADSRWFTGSGIYRPVLLEIKSTYSFERYGVFATTRMVHEGSAEIDLKWQASGDKVRFTLLAPDGQTKASVEFPAMQKEAQWTIPQVRLWSAENPFLYILRSEVLNDGVITDCIESPMGIRMVRFDADNGLFVNDKNTKLRGVCLHHDAGVLGADVPKNVWRRRLEKLREMGCNAIRTSHNPPDPALLDLCDEMGFYVMDEAFDEWEGCKNKWWQGHNVYPPKHYGYSEDFPQWHEADLCEMICRDRQHPSIILWSIGNEIDYPNDPYCSPLFQTMTGNNDKNKPAQERQYDPDKPDASRLGQIARSLVKIVKQYDSSRPVTAAIAFPELSNQVGYTDALDVVGYNYKEHLYETDHKRFPGRVIYGSENGHLPEKWTAVQENPYICGQFLWTGVDYMGEAMGWPLRVAMPGLLTMAGFEKASYYQRKALWTNRLFAVLTARPLNKNQKGIREQQQEVFGWNFTSGEPVEVSCYTNAASAVIFVNGRKLERKFQDPVSYGKLTWQLPFEEGTVSVLVEREGEHEETSLTTAGEAKNLLLHLSEQSLDLENPVAQVELTLVDAQGNPSLCKDKEIVWNCDGAEFLGCESGAPDDLTAYSSRSRYTYHGKMIAYFRLQNASATAVASLDGRKSVISLA